MNTFNAPTIPTALIEKIKTAKHLVVLTGAGVSAESGIPEALICRKDKGVLDEIPSAYKDIDVVIANQSDLVEVVHTLKQILCVKG